MKTLKLNSKVGGMALALALASILAVVPVSAAPLAASRPGIAVRAQDASVGQITVDSVTAAQDGWLMIWKDENGMPGGLLGFAPVHQSANTSMVVDLKTTGRNGGDDITPTLWASLVADSNADIPFASPDPSIMPADSVAMVAFGSEAAFAPAPAAPAMGVASSAVSAPIQSKISVRRQDASDGQVIVDSVSAAQDGWLLIWNDANGAPDSPLGFAAVHQGTSTNVVVDIKTTKRNGDDDLSATLWATLVADPSAALPYAIPDTSSLGSSLLKVAFGSTLD
jgi:hypothetical protein